MCWLKSVSILIKSAGDFYMCRAIWQPPCSNNSFSGVIIQSRQMHTGQSVLFTQNQTSAKSRLSICQQQLRPRKRNKTDQAVPSNTNTKNNTHTFTIKYIAGREIKPPIQANVKFWDKVIRFVVIADFSLRALVFFFCASIIFFIAAKKPFQLVQCKYNK